MSSVDERVVKMKLDSSNLETNANKTSKILDKLDEKLKLKNGAKGFKDIEKAAKGVSLDSLARSVENLEKRFSTLGIIGTTALVNITNSAMDAGKKIVSALTIDGAKLGFQEYETQMNAIQTILANTKSKGSTLDDVNKALEELNHYADLTIYNFTEMTSNIGRFTAAGVGLEDSVSAIKGISNLAGVVGANSEQSARAMYQLSQAISLGALKLEDWNSVQEAGLGGEIFQESLKETARVHGIEVDKIIEKEGSFRESLREGWISTEILTETLAKFTGDLSDEQLRQMGYTEEQIVKIQDMAQTALDATTKVKTFTQLFDTLGETAQSGWTQTWQILIGDFEEAKSMLTGLSDYFSNIINQMSDARNNLLQGWVDLGGREKVLQGIKNIWDGILSVIKPIGEAFRDVFPAIEAIDLYHISDAFLKFTEKMKISGETADKIKRVFKGVFALFDIGLRAVKAIGGGFIDLLGSLTPLGGGILDILAVFGDWIRELDRSIKWSGLFETAIGSITDILGGAIRVFGEWFKSLTQGLDNLPEPDMRFLYTIVERIKDRFTDAKSVGKTFFEYLSGSFDDGFTSFKDDISAIFNKVLDKFKEFVDWFVAHLPEFGNVIKNAFSASVVGVIIEFVHNLSGVPGAIGNIFNNIADVVEDSKKLIKPIKKLIGSIGDAFGDLGGMFKDFGTAAKMKQILPFALAIGVLAAAAYALSRVDPKRLQVAGLAISGLATILLGAFAIFDQIVQSGSEKSIGKIASALIPFSAAMWILGKAVTMLSQLDITGALTGVGSVIALMATMSLSLRNIGKGVNAKSALSIITLAGAVRLIVEPLKELGSLDLVTITKGILTIAGVMTSIGGALYLMQNGTSLSASITVLAIAGALNLLVEPFKQLGSIPLDQIGKSLIALTGSLGAISGALFLIGQYTNFMDTLSFMVVIGMISLLAKSLKSLGSMSISQVGTALLGLAGALTTVVLAAKLMSGGNMKESAKNVKQLAKALIMIAVPIKVLGSMSLEQVGTALIAIAGAFTILGVSGAILAPLGSQLPAVAAGLSALSLAATLLAVPLKTLGSMDLGQIGTALIGLAGAFGVLIAASYALSPIAPILGMISLPMVALSAAAVGLSASLWLISEAMVNFSQITNLGIDSITGKLPAIGEFLTTLVLSFGDAIAQLIGKVVENIPTIIDKGFEFFNGFLEGLSSRIVEIAETGANFVLTLLNGITPLVGDVIAAGVKLLVEFLGGLSQNMQQLVTKGSEVVLEFLKGVQSHMGQIVEQGIKLVISLIEGIANTAAQLVQAGMDLIVKFMNALADGIRNNTAPVMEAVTNLGSAIIEGIWTAISTGAGKVIDVVKKLASDALAAFKEVLGIHSPSTEFFNAALNCVNGFANGMAKNESDARQMAEEFSKAVLDAFNTELSISKFVDIGAQLAQGLSMGITQSTQLVVTSLQTAGLNGMNALITSFNTKKPEAVNVIRDIMTNCLTTITQFNLRYQEAGRKILSSLITGFKNRQAEAANTMRAIITSCLAEITRKNSQFTTAGRNNITSLITGFKSRQQSAINTIKQIMQYCIQQINATENSWNQSGQNVVNGFIKGIKARQKAAEKAARDMARAAAEAAREEFDEHSPSKVFEKIGRFAAEGLALGLTGYSYYVENAGKDLGQMAEEAAKEGLDAMEDVGCLGDNLGCLDGIDDVVITPIIDSTELDKDIADINDKLHNNLLPITDGNKIFLVGNQKLLDLMAVDKDRVKFLSTANNKITALKNTTLSNLKDSVTLKPANSLNTGTKVEFVQNNYSPKALTSTEIYRNTKNQLSMIKGQNTTLFSGTTYRKVLAT